MKSKTKFFIIFLLFLCIFVVYHFFRQSSFYYFDFGKTQNNTIKNDQELANIIQKNLAGINGHFAVYIEELPSSPSATLTNARKYALNANESFPTASLYKLVLLAAALKEVELGGLKLEDPITGSKSDLTKKLGNLDFGYEDMPENIQFSVEEILERIGRISDNFVAIMLTEKLRSNGSNDPLLLMAKELGMENTSFEGITNTTASDIALFFRKLYRGEVVSKSASAKIMEVLALSNINNRIPALLPEEVKVIHKTGELPLLRHDAGVVLASHPYLIVLLSKDLEFEDDGVDTLAKISGDVYDYFNKGD